MNVKQAVLGIFSRLCAEGFDIKDEYLGDNRCTATVVVKGIPFQLIAGKLSAVAHYEIPPTETFPQYLRPAISQLWGLGYRLQVAEFHAEEEGISLHLEVVLQLWDGGGIVLSVKLTDDIKQAKALLTELTTTNVTLPAGCFFWLDGYDDHLRFTKVDQALGPSYSYVCADENCRRMILLLKTAKEEAEEMLRSAGISTEVRRLSWVDVRIPRL